MFNVRNLRQILKDDKYTGLYHYDTISVSGGMPQLVSRELFDKVQKRFEINKRRGRPAIEDDWIPYCHYPMLTWPNIRGGSYMVYGHLHGNREHDPCLKHGLNPRMLNSCVEVNGYQPVTLDEMIENNRIFRQLTIPESASFGGEDNDLCDV